MQNSREQQEAFEKLSKLKVGALFMSMGTGKTKVALDLAYSKKHKVDYILWICPCSLKGEIEAEKQKWYPELEIDIVGCESIGSSDKTYVQILEKATESRTFIVLDESLKIKNRNAKRTSRILKIGEKAMYKLILNGTPISKNYCDLWTQMEFLSPKILGMSYNMFFNTYCVYYTRGRYKGRIKSFTNIPHLIDKIKPYIFEAKLDIEAKKNYHKRLYTTDKAEYEAYKWEMFEKYFDKIEQDVNFNAFTMALQKYYTQNSNRSKVIDEIIQEINDKVVVFVRFLKSIPEGAKRITGEQKQIERKEIVKEFKAGKFKTLYITYGCGAFGLNLQFCKNIIFAEHTWDYAVRDQAEARIYRMGQSGDVNYYDVVCDGVGLEDMIFKCVCKKEDMLKKIKEEIQKRKGGVKEWVKAI